MLDEVCDRDKTRIGQAMLDGKHLISSLTFLHSCSFARRSEGKQKKTFKNVTQERESEAWVHMVHHKKASPESEQQRRLLIAERHNEVSEFQVNIALSLSWTECRNLLIRSQ